MNAFFPTIFIAAKQIEYIILGTSQQTLNKEAQLMHLPQSILSHVCVTSLSNQFLQEKRYSVEQGFVKCAEFCFVISNKTGLRQFLI